MTDMVCKEGFTLKDLQRMEKDYQNLRTMLHIQSKVLTQMVENNKGVFANKMRFVLVHTNASLTHLNDLSEFINNAYKAFLTLGDEGVMQ